MDNGTQTKGRYLHTQRLSTEDGPGIRTTVFMKGCLLACEWCHNPESIKREPEVQWLAHNCIACNSCKAICPNACLLKTDKGMIINREYCIVCGTCAAECPGNAMEVLGKNISAEDLAAELLKDKAFYEKSGGGVTISGGEPAVQADFAAAVMAALQAAGIHTALDTCGMVSKGNLLKILPHADLVLYDLKLMDSEAHQQFTGQGNAVILENLAIIRKHIQDNPTTKLWIRTPLIPGATATEENIQAIGAYLSAELGELVERWELCAFNNLCANKYERLGLEWAYAGTPLLTAEEMAQYERWAQAAFGGKERTMVTGAGRVEV